MKILKNQIVIVLYVFSLFVCCNKPSDTIGDTRISQEENRLVDGAPLYGSTRFSLKSNDGKFLAMNREDGLFYSNGEYISNNSKIEFIPLKNNEALIVFSESQSIFSLSKDGKSIVAKDSVFNDETMLGIFKVLMQNNKYGFRSLENNKCLNIDENGLLVSTEENDIYPFEMVSEKLDADSERILANPGFQHQIKITQISDGVPAKNLEWKSDNLEIVIVNQKGEIEVKNYGEARITAFSSEFNETVTTLVTVENDNVNPVFPLSWKLYIADPEPYVFGKRLYIYGSKDCISGTGIMGNGLNWCSDRYHVIYTDDMINWIDAGESFNIKNIPSELKPQESIKRLWAPDVLKHPSKEEYYLYSCYNGGKGKPMVVAQSSSPLGPFKKSKALTINGKWAGADDIDPAVLVDDDDKVYISWPFVIGQLDPTDFTKVIPNSLVDLRSFMPKGINEDYTRPFEGPSLRKRGDIYYYIYIENEKSTKIKPSRMVYMTSKNPLGPYTYQGLIISNSNVKGSVNIHGSFVEFNNQYYVFYHLPVPGKTLTRALCFEKLSFNPDGTINEVKPNYKW